MRNLLCLFLGLLASQFAFAQSSTEWESQVVAFETRDATQPPPKGETVAVGSSSIRLWSTIRSDLAPAVVEPRGIGGATTIDVLYYLERLVLVHEPRRVLLYAGENDIAGGRAPRDVLATTQEIVSRIHQRLPSTRVVLMSVKPSILRWDKWPRMAEANGLLAAFAATDPRISYVDVSSALFGADGLPARENFADDLLHLSKHGYEVWTSLLRPVLLEPSPSLARCSTYASVPWGTFGTRLEGCGYAHAAR